MPDEVQTAAPQTPSERFVDSYDTGEPAENVGAPLEVATPATPSTAAPEAPAAQAVHQISASLFRRATENCGFDEQEIAEMNPAELSRAVEAVERQLLREARARSRETPHTDRPPQAPEGDGLHTVDSTAARPAAPAEADEFAGVDLTAYEPWVKTLIDGYKQLKQQVADLQNVKREFAEEKRRRADETFSEQCDRFFAGRKDVYGDGDFRTIQTGTPERFRRHQVIQGAVRINGGKAPSLAHLAKSEELLFGPRAVAAAAPPVATVASPEQSEPSLVRDERGRFVTPDAYARAALARPTQRDQVELPPGREKAIRTAERIMGQRSTAASNGSADEANENDFPD